VVNDELDYKIDEDQENKEQSARPGEQIKSKKDAGQKAID